MGYSGGKKSDCTIKTQQKIPQYRPVIPPDENLKGSRVNVCDGDESALRERRERPLQHGSEHRGAGREDPGVSLDLLRTGRDAQLISENLENQPEMSGQSQSTTVFSREFESE